ncbi:GRB2-associated and regulator of MAPK -like [Paramuricea clavata]|uniref:GRB2-associated and regulator of MAPK -like n=1 Tax=Paramuricea clavata TaxID=317549 RepID=A0A6S7GM43_PARCT|nr:GRB2-associated and regulator of MAPK -like [Paramuricea clavata]
MLGDENQNPYTRISEIPQDLSLLSVEDVGNVLQCLNMHDYVELFANEMIDGAILKDLDLDSFKAINVNLFHAKKLLKFIGGWRPGKGREK